MEPTAEELDPYEGGASETHSVVEARVGHVAGGSYRISRYLGSGGSSHVFEAEHVRLGKRFAVKLLRTEIDSGHRASQRFRREAKAVARLQSEHIVSVVDCGELPDQTPYLVMELLEGGDLRSLLRSEGALPARRAIQLMLEASRGLAVVHSAGLVHRDLKPENLFVTRRATGEDWCKILDFGVAKMEASLSTAEGAIVGTARYMAPEQLVDSAAVGPATDVYALGAILYECLSGRAAHSGDTIQQVMFSVVNTEPEALSKKCPHLPRTVVDLVESCLAKAPSKRPATAAAFEARLLGVFGREPDSGRDLTLAEDASATFVIPVTRPRRSWVTASLGVVTLATAGFFWSSYHESPERTPRLNHTDSAAIGPRPQSEPKPVTPPLPLEVKRQASPTVNATSPTSSAPTTPRPIVRATPIAQHSSPPKALEPLPKTNLPQGHEVTVGNFDQANPYSE